MKHFSENATRRNFLRVALWPKKLHEANLLQYMKLFFTREAHFTGSSLLVQAVVLAKQNGCLARCRPLHPVTVADARARRREPKPFRRAYLRGSSKQAQILHLRHFSCKPCMLAMCKCTARAVPPTAPGHGRRRPPRAQVSQHFAT